MGSDPAITESARKFVQSPQRQGMALCLSGGGYRAALFHLGAVKRLNELGILGQLDDITSVSGGSIFAAFLAMRWNAIADFDHSIAKPFREFTKNNIRTMAALSRAFPWNWGNPGAGAEGLEAKYEQLLVPGKKIRDLPALPRFHICSTDLAFGVNWSFTRDQTGDCRVGDYQAGYLDAAKSGEMPLALAVAVSSCFPPVFRPKPMNLRPEELTGGKASGSERDACVRSIALTDGGVYDNMGLEPVWKNSQTLLVCDGGKPFRFSKSTQTLQQLLRLYDIMGDQAEAVRKRWLISSFIDQIYGGTYWGIASAVSKYEVPNAIGYSEALADEVISTIRTDMDRFSEDEAGVLENHGYSLADVAIQKHVPDLYKSVAFHPPAPELWPGESEDERIALEVRIRKLLADSSSVWWLGH